MNKKYLIIYIITFIISFYGCSTTKSTSKKSYYGSKSHKELMKYCKSWIGTPHKMGGTTKQGVDCSGFVQNVYKDIYGINLPRRSQDMEGVVDIIKERKHLKTGDLVFFNGKKGAINHVGIFLKDSSFVHTSTSKGVMISNLYEKYWDKIYRNGGRHPQLKKNK